MGYLTVGFSYNSGSFISKAVSWFTRGKYSHVVLFHNTNGMGIESTGLGKVTGVKNIYLSEFLQRPGAVLRKIEHSCPEKVWDIANSQIGKKYDWLYFLGWLLHNSWQGKNRWVCQELIIWAAYQAGDPIIPTYNASWLSPQSLWLISKELKNEG